MAAGVKRTPAIYTANSAKPATGRAVRVNITLPEDVLTEIDRYAQNHGFTRSGFLAQAAKRAMKEPA